MVTRSTFINLPDNNLFINTSWIYRIHYDHTNHFYKVVFKDSTEQLISYYEYLILIEHLTGGYRTEEEERAIRRALEETERHYPNG